MNKASLGLSSLICLVANSVAGSIALASPTDLPPLVPAPVEEIITAELPAEPTPPNNVILIIGDGMDDHQITIARNYLVGATGRLTLDEMAHRGAVQVLTVSNEAPAKPVFVADSANSATAIATGVVTSRGRLSTSAGSDLDITTIVEMAAAADIKTGLVSTASVTDATVAAFYAHISGRACENPAMMTDALLFDRVPVDCSQDLKSNGGQGSISEQLVASNVDVVLGGGLKHFQPNAEGQSVPVSALAEAAGFQVLTSIEELNTATLEDRWLGLFGDGTLPTRLQGENGRTGERPVPSWMNRVHWSQGEVTLPEPMSCEDNPEFAGTPTLQQMTDRALARLSHDNTDGFFLMVESASIDKQSHARDACGSLGEVEQLDEALKSALNFAEDHPNTLIIVTADHGQAAQLVPTESLFEPYNLPIYSPGQLVRLRTSSGSLMTVNYATNEFVLEEHTGVNVPLFSNNETPLPTMLTQPDLFSIMTNYLGLAD
jgi:alkaline phosphatase